MSFRAATAQACHFEERSDEKSPAWHTAMVEREDFSLILRSK
jgi:hypothetical protein